MSRVRSGRLEKSKFTYCIYDRIDQLGLQEKEYQASGHCGSVDSAALDRDPKDRGETVTRPVLKRATSDVPNLVRKQPYEHRQLRTLL